MQTAILGASTGFSAMGEYQAGKAASAASLYNAQIADNNAQIAAQNAQWAAEEGVQKGAAEQMKMRAREGGILANQGASGVDVASKSSVDVRDSARQLGMLDVMTIRANAARKAYGYQIEEAGFRAEGGLRRQEAKNAERAGQSAAIGTLLGGAAKAAAYGDGDPYSDYLSKKSTMSYTYTDGGSSDSVFGIPADAAIGG